MPQKVEIEGQGSILIPQFEELFASLVKESRNIEIQYLHKSMDHSSQSKTEISIVHVNGCSTHEEFRERLARYLTDSLQSLQDLLLKCHSSIWLHILDFIRTNLQYLSKLVRREQITLPDETGQCNLNYQFNSFTNCKLTCQGEVNYNIFNQGIRYKAEKFAIIWLEIIQEAIMKVDLMQNILLESLKETQPKEPIIQTANNTFKPKLNLSVAQLGYLMNLMVRSGVIDLPSNSITKLILWSSENLQSKNQSSIHHSSLRNKYNSPDQSTVDSIEKTLLGMIDLIKEDCEKFSK